MRKYNFYSKMFNPKKKNSRGHAYTHSSTRKTNRTERGEKMQFM